MANSVFTHLAFTTAFWTSDKDVYLRPTAAPCRRKPRLQNSPIRPPMSEVNVIMIWDIVRRLQYGGHLIEHIATTNLADAPMSAGDSSIREIISLWSAVVCIPPRYIAYLTTSFNTYNGLRIFWPTADTHQSFRQCRTSIPSVSRCPGSCSGTTKHSAAQHLQFLDIYVYRWR